MIQHPRQTHKENAAKLTRFLTICRNFLPESRYAESGCAKQPRKSPTGNLPNNSPARRPGAAGRLCVSLYFRQRSASVAALRCAKRTATVLPHAVTEPSPRHRHRAKTEEPANGAGDRLAPISACPARRFTIRRVNVMAGRPNRTNRFGPNWATVLGPEWCVGGPHMRASLARCAHTPSPVSTVSSSHTRYFKYKS
jgi:hypothetical protein